MWSILAFITVCILVVGGPLIWSAWRGRGTATGHDVVFLALVPPFADGESFKRRLERAGVGTYLRDARNHLMKKGPWGQSFSSDPVYGLWVRAKDEERARRILESEG